MRNAESRESAIVSGKFRIALLMVLTIAFQTGCCSTTPEQVDSREIRAKKLILEDENLTPRLVFEVDGKTARAGILDPTGACRIRLEVDPAGQPSISLLHPDGTVQFAVFGGGGSAHLVINNRAGKTQFSIDASDTDGVALGLNAKDGQPRVKLDVTPEGEGHIRIRDAEGKTVFVAPQ